VVDEKRKKKEPSSRSSSSFFSKKKKKKTHKKRRQNDSVWRRVFFFKDLYVYSLRAGCEINVSRVLSTSSFTFPKYETLYKSFRGVV
jgi:hypothetical protein